MEMGSSHMGDMNNGGRKRKNMKGDSKDHTVPEGTSEKTSNEEGDEAGTVPNVDGANGDDVPLQDEEQEEHPSGNKDENGLKKKKKKLRKLKKYTDESDSQEDTQQADKQKQAHKISKKDFILKSGAHKRGGEAHDEEEEQQLEKKENNHDGESPPDNAHETPPGGEIGQAGKISQKEMKRKKDKRKAKGEKKHGTNSNGDSNGNTNGSTEANAGANSDASYCDGDHQAGSKEEEEDDDYGGFHSDDHLGSEPDEEDELSQGDSEQEKTNKSRRKKKARGGTQKKSEPKGDESKVDKDGDNAVQIREKKKKMKNSRLMEDINPDEDKHKLKLICMSFHKKEYDIEEFIFESLKVIIPQYKREVFLNQQNIIIDRTSREDLKNLEIFWFDRLTKNRRRSIISCFTTLGKMGLGGKETNALGASEIVMSVPENVMSVPENVMSVPENVMSAPEFVMSIPENVMSVPENVMSVSEIMISAPENATSAPENAETTVNPLLEHIFTKKKDQIIVDHLAALCTQQVKLVKEYISYMRKNIFDLSSISENNDKIKELNILDPIKRRELFFYLNLCISMNYIQEQAPNVYAIPNDLCPDIRGFNLHPMFSHINKKQNEKKREKGGNPWEKLKLLKKSQKMDVANKSSDTSMRKTEVVAQMSTKKNEVNEKESEEDRNDEKKKNDKHIDDNEMLQKKILEEEQKKKKSIRRNEKKKKRKR
ncbi:hypothetical protein C922_01941 [Plasmodium inui San Antonio 1]|uniref:Uncharacterized protein n=1 Tax=Plasmodium inui San Antonio 1 TaxID=1237626 RepID=W7A3D6_9APIC|nr:hypothetical protein C922_01941 [Plasmodium inui San Antonio 1]EUD67752.1 hypothetical protein C922_01941 [Plasmodium inui San Antonio 1]